MGEIGTFGEPEAKVAVGMPMEASPHERHRHGEGRNHNGPKGSSPSLTHGLPLHDVRTPIPPSIAIRKGVWYSWDVMLGGGILLAESKDMSRKRAVAGLAGLLLAGVPVGAWAVESPVFDATPQVEAWAEKTARRPAKAATGRYAWDVERYATGDWTAWDARVAAWFGDVGRVALYAPPVAGDGVCFSEKGLWEATGAFAAVTNAVPPLPQDGVPTWPVWVWERVSPEGLRTFGTAVGTAVCRETAADPAFGALRWALQRYGELGRQPPWTEAQGWLAERGRERFGFSATLVPQGLSAAYRAAMDGHAREEAEKDAANPAAASPLRVTGMAILGDAAVLEYYNPYLYEIGLFSKRSYAQATWDFHGPVESAEPYARVVVPFPEESAQAPRLFKLADLESDEDADGVPDTLETNVFGCDPQRADTAGSGLTDWQKLFVYGLSPAVADTDGDGATDGEEVLRGTNPRVADGEPDPIPKDTDGDGLPDVWEGAHGLNPESATEADGAEGDPDGDGLPNLLEQALGTHPRKADTDGDGLPDGWEVRHGLNPLSAEDGDGALGDPDKDGLSNGQELSAGTCPTHPDSDGDALPDGWETRHGLNPRSAEGDDGALGDPDGDGLPNVEEWRWGTAPDTVDSDGDGLHDGRECEVGSDPTTADTDGDGLSDYDEVGGFQRRESVWFPIAGGRNLLSGVTSAQDRALYEVALPFTLPLGGMVCTRLKADVNGCVFLTDAAGVGVPSSENANRDLLGTVAVSEASPFVAGYWDDLLADPAKGSAIWAAEGTVDGEQLFIVEFRDVFLYDRQTPPEKRLSFQIALSRRDPGRIYLNYRNLGAAVDGGSATIGLLLPKTRQAAQYAFDRAGSVTEGLSLVGRVATGTDPRRADTDGDGLSDGEEAKATGTDPRNADSDGDGLDDGQELAARTDPAKADSDGDGMPDGWEVKYGLNPLENDAKGDADRDGLTNLREYQNRTDPTDPDTDGDGLSDLEESGSGSSALNPDSDGDGLLDGQEVALGTYRHLEDSDNDELWDGWEVRYGLNPLSEPTARETHLDPDGDGLPNLAEFRNGTNPLLADTDGDGLSDAEELGRIRSDLPVPAGTGLDMADLTGRFANAGTACVDVDLPQPLTIRGRTYTFATVDLNGLVYLRTPDDSAVIRSRNGAYDMADPNANAIHAPAIVLAPFWDDLTLSPAGGSAIRVGTLVYGTRRNTVFEFVNVGFNGRAFATDRVSFRLIVLGGVCSANEPFAYVHYTDAVGRGNGVEASVGFQGHWGRPRHAWGWRRAGMVGTGMGLAFQMGYGTRPDRKDTDGDGLTDYEELFPSPNARVAAGATNPRQSDTDGDGLNDAWERRYGYDPLTPNDPDADADGDGLTDLEESKLGTNPRAADSDGDGTDDGAEVRQCSDPDDAADRGAPGSRVPVSFAFGDPSGSHSEKYFLRIEPEAEPGHPTPSPPAKAFRWVNATYGEVETRTAMLREGGTYRCTLAHADTKPDQEQADPDYEWGIATASGTGCLVKDPQGALGSFSDDGDILSGKVCRIHVLGTVIAFDTDRDGKIDETDRKAVPQGRPFRHWVNDDWDNGDVSDLSLAKEQLIEPSDRPRGEDAYWADCNETRFGSEVNGRTDLEDFAPLLIDFAPLADAFPLAEGYRYWLRQENDALSVVYTKLTPETVGEWFRKDVGGCGSDLAAASHEADVSRMEDGALELTETAFLEQCLSKKKPGILMVEGCHASESPLRLEIVDREGTCRFSAALSLRIDPVGRMFRTVNLRGTETGYSVKATPAHPDDESDGTLFFFVHGYNVNEVSAEAWNATMFKRLWQTGAHLTYVGVLWRGNESQSPLTLGQTPNYYANVENALAVAPRFKDAVEQVKTAVSATVPVKKTVVAAHSLGNMLVSSAITRHGLTVGRYLMLNAAVPMEAYSPAAVTEVSARDMCPPEWRAYETRLRASRWHLLFSKQALGGKVDARNNLTWRGFFGPIPNAVNFYSEGEEVLANPEANGDRPFLLSSERAWVNQEMRKGVWPRILPGNNEAGWAFSEKDYWEVAMPGQEQSPVWWSPKEMKKVPDSALRYAPFFSAFDNPEIVTDGGSDFLNANTNVYHRILADGIPAESFATGANVMEGKSVLRSVKLESEGTWWPTERGLDPVLGPKWQHSDLKNVAYPYTSYTFTKILKWIETTPASDTQ